ncbi:MAG: helicase-related protein, partial [Ferruginibacter sp.]
LHAEKGQERGRKQIKALILTPTRELAIQIDESFAAYGKYTGLSHAVIFGGVSQLHQTNQLRNGIDILVATPGRLLDLMSQGFIGLQHLKIFVLDEADRMLDMGFIHDVKRVIIKLPVKRQTLFFSATMPPEIQTLANVLLTNPAKVAVTPVSSTVEAIDQSLFFVDRNNKPGLLLYLLKNEKIVTALVFTRTKHGADKVVKILHKENITAAAIHGNKSQNARQHALSSFKNGKLRVLVATDIAARGIDIDELSHVINFELPNVPETYIHRIGRTGRAGNTGIAFSFCDAEERTELKDIQKLIGKNIPVVDSHPYPLSAGSFVPRVAGPQRPEFKKPGNNFHSSDRGGRRGYGMQRTGNK